jgi:hypothetical protein
MKSHYDCLGNLNCDWEALLRWPPRAQRKGSTAARQARKAKGLPEGTVLSNSGGARCLPSETNEDAFRCSDPVRPVQPSGNEGDLVGSRVDGKVIFK